MNDHKLATTFFNWANLGLLLEMDPTESPT